MPLINDLKILTPAERSLWRHPMMWISACAIAVVPLLYSTIYLASSLDPYGNLSQLPVALVNLDTGTTIKQGPDLGQKRNIGAETTEQLKDDRRFNYLSYDTSSAAEDAVQRGVAYFALSIPKDFSQKALSGSSSQHGLLRFYVAEGSSYFASRVANTFAETLSDTLNTKLGTNRWDVVQTSLAEVQRGFADIRSATGKLRDGAVTLQEGSTTLNKGAGDLLSGAAKAASGGTQLSKGVSSLSGGVGKLTSGSAELADGLRQLEAAAPSQQQLAPLSDGAAKLSSGSAALSSGLAQLSDGAAQLSAGAQSANTGAGQLAAGSQQLAKQLPNLQNGLMQLSDGAQQLSSDARAANTGAQQLAAGNKQLATQLPQLAAGLTQAKAAASSLSAGTTSQAQGMAQPLSSAKQPQTGTATLSSALANLSTGTGAAADGALSLSVGAAKLTEGTAQLKSGAATLADKLSQAAQGSAAAVKGAQQLSAGTAQLQSGTVRLQTGAATLSQKTQQAAKGAASLKNGAIQLENGIKQLTNGNLKIKTVLGNITKQLPANDNLKQLSSGAVTLAQKSSELSNGLSSLQNGAGKLSDGVQKLQDGAGKLRDGLNTLYDKIPAQVEQLGGDPAGLSQSVLPIIRTFAPVKNNGAGFAPYFMALSLWVGVTLTTFIFPYQQLPQSGRRTSQFSRMLRKAAVPAVLVMAQALLVVWGVHLLGVQYLHPWQVIFTALLSSLTFLVIVLGLIFLLGAAGRLLALILLVLQLAASGGSYPVELAPKFFQVIHNYVPVTQSINAFRHAISGAFKGSYPTFIWALLALAVVGALIGLAGRRRWEFVADNAFKPLVSLPRQAND